MYRLPILTTLLALMVTAANLQAQTQFTLYKLSNTVPEANLLNPALLPSHRVTISLPVLGSVYTSMNNDNLAINDLFTDYGNGGLNFIATEADEDRILNALRDVNDLDLDAQVNLFYIGYRANNNYFSFSATQKGHATLSYTKELINWAIKGPASDNFINSAFRTDDIFLEAQSYLEWGFGYTREVNNKFTIGGRIKLLQGQVSINTEELDASIFSNADSANITVNRMLINTTGLIDGLSANDVLFNTSNIGFGFDLGVVITPIERLKISAAINNVGRISWSENTEAYSLNNVTYDFEGFDVLDLVNDNDTDDLLGSEADTIEARFDPVETLGVDYSTTTPINVYAGADFEFRKGQRAGAMLYAQVIKNKIKPALGLSYNLQIRRVFNLAATASVIDGQFSNLGLGFSVKGGPIQFYAATDNALGALLPARSSVFDLRLGLTLAFGKVADSNSRDDSR